MPPTRPIVFVGDDSPTLMTTLTEKLDAAGVQAYFTGPVLDPSSPTKFIGGFKCALLPLERPVGKDDPIDEAELLRMYQPELPVAFLYEGATTALLDRARAMGPVFRKSDQVEGAIAWALGHANK
jgi:hypothetical protein